MNTLELDFSKFKSNIRDEVHSFQALGSNTTKNFEYTCEVTKKVVALFTKEW